MSTFDEVKARFDDALGNIGGVKSERAITAIVILVESRTNPKIPVDTSVLINSAFRKVEKTPGGWLGEAGYGAHYAAAVHEMPGKLKGQPRSDFGRTGNTSDFGPRTPESFGGGTGVGNYWDPDGEPKFLEKGIAEAMPLISRVLTEEYGIE